MKGKVKSVFVHIINIIFAIASALLFGILIAALLKDIGEGEAIDMTKILVLIIFAVPTIGSLLSEVTLIISQVKRRYDPYVLATGFLNNIILIVASAFVLCLSFNKETPDSDLIIVSVTILALTLINLLLYILINHDNKAIFVTAAKAVESPAVKKEVATEEKPEIVEKAPAAAKKPAPVKKAAPKKATTKKSVAKKKPTTKKKK